MDKSRGAVSFTPLFTTDDIGLRKDASVEHVVKVFLNVGEAIAARWIEMPRGILLLQTVPDETASGAIYLYDRERHIFFFVNFVDGRDDSSDRCGIRSTCRGVRLGFVDCEPGVSSSERRQPEWRDGETV